MKDEINVTKYIVEFKDRGFFRTHAGFNYVFVEEAKDAFRFDTREDAEKTGLAGVPKQGTHYRVLEFRVVQTYSVSYGIEWSPREPEEYWQVQVRLNGVDEERSFLISQIDDQIFTGIQQLGGRYVSELIAVNKALKLFTNENVKQIRLVNVVDDSVTYDEWYDHLDTQGAYTRLDASDRGFT